MTTLYSAPEFVPAQPKWRHADIGVLTVIPIELQWARKALEISEASRHKNRLGRIYFSGELTAHRAPRPYRVVLTCVGEAGTVECGVAATSLIYDYRPKMLILVGIAAGMKTKTKIGNVIISEIVWGYEKGTIETGRRGRLRHVPRPDVGRLDFRVQQDLTTYLSFPEREARIAMLFASLGGRYPKPPSARSLGVRAAARRARLFKDHVAVIPQILDGTLASGNKLLKNPRVLYRLQREGHGRTAAGEMEASGLVEACRQLGVPWLVVRGISDFGDKFKADDFHSFAAKMSAAVLRDFLTQGLQLSIASSRRPKRGPLVADVPSVAEIQHAASHLHRLSSPQHPVPPAQSRLLELAEAFRGHVFRIARKERPPDVATQEAGRWHTQLPALYFARSTREALLEVVAAHHPSVHISHLARLVIAEFAVRLSRVLDFTNPAVLASLNVDNRRLIGNDYTYAQSVAEAARAAKCEGLLVPSALFPATSHLVVFDRNYEGSELRLVHTTSLLDQRKELADVLDQTGISLMGE